MPIFPEANTIFIDVPRSGTVAVREWFMRHSSCVGEPHQLPEAYAGIDMPSVIVARNVYDRVASACAKWWHVPGFFDKWLDGKIPFSASMVKFIGDLDPEIVPFENLADRFPGIMHLNRSDPIPLTDEQRIRVAKTYADEIEMFGWE